MAENQRLDELCHINMGQSPDSESYNQDGDGIPFFQGNADFGTMYPVTRVWCNSPTKVVEPGTLLISVRAPIGALNFAKERSCIGRGLAGITPRSGVYLKYIYYCLKSKIKELNAKGTGSTFKAIAKNALGETSVRIASETEQQRIIQILDRVSSIIDARKQQLTELDALIKAQFVEMFGDPVRNPKGWPMIQLGSRCDIITGNTPSRSELENYGSYIEWIKSDNVNTPYTKLTRAEEYLSEVGFSKCRYVDAGSILMTCIAGSVSCIGNVALVDRRVSFNQQINAIVPQGDEPLYLYYLIALSKPWIHRVINKSLKGILSKGQLSDMIFPFPPYELQSQFAKCAVQIDKSKFRCVASRNLWKYAVKYIWDGLYREMVL